MRFLRGFGVSLRDQLIWMVVVVGIAAVLTGVFHVDSTVAAAGGLGGYALLQFALKRRATGLLQRPTQPMPELLGQQAADDVVSERRRGRSRT